MSRTTTVSPRDTFHPADPYAGSLHRHTPSGELARIRPLTESDLRESELRDGRPGVDYRAQFRNGIMLVPGAHYPRLYQPLPRSLHEDLCVHLYHWLDNHWVTLLSNVEWYDPSKHGVAISIVMDESSLGDYIVRLLVRSDNPTGDKFYAQQVRGIIDAQLLVNGRVHSEQAWYIDYPWRTLDARLGLS